MTKLYLSGPMRGIEDDNFPAFEKVARELRLDGNDVVSPHESFGGDRTLSQEVYLRHDILEVLDCDQVCLLPGYEFSIGCAVEIQVATAAGIPMWECETLKNVEFPLLPVSASWPAVGSKGFSGTFAEFEVYSRAVLARSTETVLEEAQRIVHGDRGAKYGHPLDDFTRTGRMVAAVLGLDEVTAEQIALIQMCVKISREVNAHHRDNLVDVSGYAEAKSMVHAERERRSA